MHRVKAAVTARERVRAELTQEIKDVARAHLTEHGSAGLSLRAIARELGMASSAIYRYFPSRNELLTALIVDAYNEIGLAAEQAEATIARADLLGRWLATTHAARTWAVVHPQEYALIFGSPIPGYQAPSDTLDPAARIPFVLLQILADSRGDHAHSRSANLHDHEAEGQQLGVTEVHDHGDGVPGTVAADLSRLRGQLPPELQHLDEPLLARGIAAWTMLIGSISFELFGHLHNVIDDYATYFDHQMRVVAQSLGLASGAPVIG